MTLDLKVTFILGHHLKIWGREGTRKDRKTHQSINKPLRFLHVWKMLIFVSISYYYFVTTNLHLRLMWTQIYLIRELGQMVLSGGTYRNSCQIKVKYTLFGSKVIPRIQLRISTVDELVAFKLTCVKMLFVLERAGHFTLGQIASVLNTRT